MKQKKIVKLLLPYFLLVGVLFLSYTYFLKDFYWNNAKQTIKVESSKSDKVLKLQKHAAQSKIHALEIEIKGMSKENITVLLGTSKQQITWQISLKKGEIDFSNSIEWSSDSCFVRIQQTGAKRSTLTLDYQFIGEN